MFHSNFNYLLLYSRAILFSPHKHTNHANGKSRGRHAYKPVLFCYWSSKQMFLRTVNMIVKVNVNKKQQRKEKREENGTAAVRSTFESVIAFA